MTSITKNLQDEQATIELGVTLSLWVSAPLVIYLTGDLGAGKTTLSRGLIQGLGHAGNVKSPTYTLVEPYELKNMDVFHFDLYRLLDPEELEYMGIRDYFTDKSISIIEWPDRGHGLLPDADLAIHLRYQGEQRQVELSGLTPSGQLIVDKLK
ncbi:tRNA (adenosine(37)-N6)-threonylcarbamoyltransferase complex ATPase subunit type 1 TsaE [Shewanella sp. KT0246]|uniref:tRNA (adenosine(37)-N6)-threonylcarbamoyltransferase complex ATPase subunit type 1 TsaE n=1 Tax=Shewanella sp. KT0246 TaxID=2815912 RepID=UPI001BC1A49C|nr:tRNA (adenosine(37)-N6)-threonylcarbamoyltransferase complex ATPase subunit type 1 TsaE [Shewanella sp. KT0246]GIU48771.1 tRNA (adenosine(37)-N6)-threonylcarbamoyltransferase complex ATPase subunit type 1 TsaE [Shewanella sp. KT0246]